MFTFQTASRVATGPQSDCKNPVSVDIMWEPCQSLERAFVLKIVPIRVSSLIVAKNPGWPSQIVASRTCAEFKSDIDSDLPSDNLGSWTWVVVKIMVPFGSPKY